MKNPSQNINPLTGKPFEDPSFNVMHERLREHNTQVDNLYKAHTVWKDKIKAKLTRKGQIAEKNSADAYEVYLDAIKQMEQITEKIRTEAKGAEDKLWDGFVPPYGKLALQDAREAVEYLNSLGINDRREALAESQELRQLVARYESVFGQARIGDVLHDLNQVFLESELEALTGIRAVDKALPDMESSFRSTLQGLFSTEGKISWEHSKDLYDNMYSTEE